MELQARNVAKYTVFTAKGRLDATWAEYFADTFLNYIRNGNHHIIIDASGVDFLSSAGIRSLVRIYKELFVVNGSFRIVNATEFVCKTLETTGFGDWLFVDFPEDMVTEPDALVSAKPGMNERYILNCENELEISTVEAWLKWNAINLQNLKIVQFPENVFALGTGSASLKKESAIDEFGEFMAIDGNLVYQAPGDKGRPDFQLSVNQFIPEMLVARGLLLKGDIGQLFRFSPTNEKPSYTISELSAEVLSVTESQVAAFVIIAEIDGLVGAAIVQSPGIITDEAAILKNDMRDWLSFSGDRVFNGELVALFGVVSNSDEFKYKHLLHQLPSHNSISAHIHATIFPYQPLPNGNISLRQQIGKLFSGPPPVALLHLIDDNRSHQKLGESSLIRGACWCSPVKVQEDRI